MNSLFKRRAWSFSLAVMFLFILGAVAFAQPKPAQAATLVVLQGQAMVMHNQALPISAGEGEQLVAAGRAMSVNAGDEISLSAGASAQLRLFDGSTVDLFENTSLQVTELQTSESKYRVGLNMLAGKTVSRVKRLLGVGDAFKVSTPSSTASVRGTVFTVEVLGPDSSYISCDEGIVWVEMEDQQAEVSAGYEVTAVLGQPLNVQSQTEEAPVIIAEAPPAEAPPVEAPPVTVPPVEDPPPVEAPPAEVPGHTPDESDMPDEAQGDPPDSSETAPIPPVVKSQDKPRPPGVVFDGTTDEDGNLLDGTVVTSGDKGDSITGELDGTEGKPDKGAVPGHTPTTMPEDSQGTPPEGGAPPPGQDNSSSENNNAGGNPNNQSGNNSGDNKGKKDK